MNFSPIHYKFVYFNLIIYKIINNMNIYVNFKRIKPKIKVEQFFK